MKVIGIMNRKGGVGKTTTVCNLAYWLASGHRKRVLVVDLDGQGNATDCLAGPEHCRAERGVGDAAPYKDTTLTLGAAYGMFQVFNTCRGFIRTVPMLVYSETRPEDIDTDMEDHIYDEWRYVMMASPISPRPNVKRAVPEEDPLDLYREQQTGTKVLRI